MLNIIYNNTLSLIFLRLKKVYLSITCYLYYYIIARILVGKKSFTTRFAH